MHVGHLYGLLLGEYIELGEITFKEFSMVRVVIDVVVQRKKTTRMGDEDSSASAGHKIGPQAPTRTL